MPTSGLPFSAANWVDAVARHAYREPEGVAIRFEGRSITWSELHQRGGALAAAFAQRGVAPGDRVAVLMTNRPEFVEATLAANAAGAIAVPVNFRLAPEEAAYLLQHSDAKVLVTDAPLAGLAAAAVKAAGTPTRIVTVGVPDGADESFIAFDELLAGAA